MLRALPLVMRTPCYFRTKEAGPGAARCARTQGYRGKVRPRGILHCPLAWESQSLFVREHKCWWVFTPPFHGGLCQKNLEDLAEPETGSPSNWLSQAPHCSLRQGAALRPLELSADRLGLEQGCWGPGLFRPHRCKASSWRWEAQRYGWKLMVSSQSLPASLTL